MLKYLYSPQPTEQINLTIESSLVWEVILGISGYTHTRLRHTFEFDEEWTIAHKSMPEQLVKSLALIEKLILVCFNSATGQIIIVINSRFFESTSKHSCRLFL